MGFPNEARVTASTLALSVAPRVFVRANTTQSRAAQFKGSVSHHVKQFRTAQVRLPDFETPHCLRGRDRLSMMIGKKGVFRNMTNARCQII